jgi:predicted Zn-dependent protease
MASQNRMPEAIKLLQDAVARSRSAAISGWRCQICTCAISATTTPSALQGLLKTDPKSADLLLRLAETQRRKGDVNAAIETFHQASQAAPGIPAAAAGSFDGWHRPPRPGEADYEQIPEDPAGPSDRSEQPGVHQG